jgi:dTDP-4-amino-4,6-dideoxygalactose transaminase
MKVDLISLKREYDSIKTEVHASMQRVLDNTSFIFGKELVEFEQEFAAFCTTKHALGTDSGTGSLELALRAFDIKEGDEVIVPTFTFYATAAAVCYLGAKPVFIDSEEDTGNMDMGKLESYLQKKGSTKIKAIIPVHIFGQPVDMDRLMKISKQYGIKIIEDACQAHGAQVKVNGEWRIAGSIGEIACFSFYPAKNLGCYGDGGIITTNNTELSDKIKLLRDYGRTDKYLHQSIGYNKRLDTLQAAVLHAKLGHLNEWNKMRVKSAELYKNLLAPVTEVKPLAVSDYAKPVYHQFVIRVKDRDTLRDHLAKQGVATGVHYPIPLHLQPAFGFLGYKKGDMPAAEKLGDQVLSLPMFPLLAEDEVRYVAGQITGFFNKK